MTWWVIVTNPACELRAVRDCLAAGIEAWTPTRMVRFRCRHMRQAVERAYPSFPGYAFVEPPGVDPDEAWHRLRAIDDVRAILVNAGRPLVISDLEMARIREHLEGIATIPVDVDVWRKDDVARISDIRSPFYGQLVAVERGPRRGSVQVLLSLFGRETAVEVAVGKLERVA